jgi:2'-hydroxyisoflavone reductase
MAKTLDACARAAGGSARFTWLDEAFLIEQGAVPWMEIPLWLQEESAGILAVSVERAIAAGLTFRPLEATILDTLAWSRSAPAAETSRPGVGLSREKEQELLAAWRERAAATEERV